MINQIGQNDYGLYTLVNSLIAMFLMDFGISSATARYVAKYRSENREEELEKFLSVVYKLYMLIDAIIMIVLNEAALEPTAEFRKLTASLLTPTTKSKMARRKRNTIIPKNIVSIMYKSCFAISCPQR